jgi:Protein of unknown function (DUF3606)
MLTEALMAARRAVRTTVASSAARQNARAAVDRAKRSLGERGPVWWTDGAPDYNRHLATNTPYAAWYASTLTDSLRLLREPEDSQMVVSEETFRSMPMTAKKKAKKSTRGRTQDRARVAGGQKYEVAYEAKKTKKKAATVRGAVKKVGNSRKKVNKALSGR